MQRLFASSKRKSDKRAPLPQSQSPVSKAANGPGQSLLQLQQNAGNQAVQELLRSKHIQAKLFINNPDDPEEREADQVADRVMRTSNEHTGAAPCPCMLSGGEPCDACKRKFQSTIYRRAIGPAPPTAHPQVREILKSSGRPLDASTRAFFEPRFGMDFGHVRIHTDSHAADSARAIRARAFTAGSDIAFASGEFAPNTTEGRHLIAHELAHTLQPNASGPILRRDPAPTPNTTSDGPNAAALTEGIERDKRAFTAVQSRVGKEAAKVFTHVPKGPEDLKNAESFVIESILDRSQNSDSRKGFETQSQAAAYASLNSRPAGAAVIEEQSVFFAAKLKANPNLSLIAHKPSIPDFDWKDLLNAGRYGAKVVTSDWNKYQEIYRIDRATGVLTIVGQDGMLFPLATQDGGMPTDVSDSGAVASQLKKEQVSASPNAADLRSLAGLSDPGAKSEIKPGQETTFIVSYFRSRAEESLDANEQLAENLASDFKPAEPANQSAPGSRISNKAKGLIDSSRTLAADLRKILELQAVLQGKLDYVENAISREIGGGAALKLTIDGKNRLAVDWKRDFRVAIDDITQGVLQIRSTSPMLALLVPEERQERPATSTETVTKVATTAAGLLNPVALGYTLATNKQVKEFILNTPRTPQGVNQVDASLFGQAQSPENDEKLRAGFEKKLDATKQAIRRARGEIVNGSTDLLLGLPGLRMMVESDLSKNAALKISLDKILENHEIKEIAWTVAETIVQVGSLFLPGGAFISAAIGFGIAARDLGKDLQKWEIAQAGAIDPSTALITQQQAEEALVASTLALALSAVDLGSSALPELEGAKVLMADSEGAAKGFVREIKGLPDASGVGTHELGIGPLGIPRCSDAPACLILSESLKVRGAKLDIVAPDADVNWFMKRSEIHSKIQSLQTRAEALNKRAIDSLTLPASAQEATQKQILREAEQVELEMTRIEHQFYDVSGKQLPAEGRGKWDKGTPDDGEWRPYKGHPAYRYTKGGTISYHAKFPNLTPWAIAEVNLDVMEGAVIDFEKADKLGAAWAFQRDPKYFGKGGVPDPEKFREWRLKFGYTWHHKENLSTMQLVPTDLHSSIPHLGGSSLAKGKVP